jgi:hypothetical protein
MHVERPPVVRGRKGKPQGVAKENVVTPARAVKKDAYSELRADDSFWARVRASWIGNA